LQLLGKLVLHVMVFECS